ncbi:MAG: hypothetical protein V8Q30_05105 [Acutalibacteraceae bacterium]
MPGFAMARMRKWRSAPDGSGEKIYWFRGVATVIRDEKQQPVSAILSFTDISSQKQLASEDENPGGIGTDAGDDRRQLPEDDPEISV